MGGCPGIPSSRDNTGIRRWFHVGSPRRDLRRAVLCCCGSFVMTVGWFSKTFFKSDTDWESVALSEQGFIDYIKPNAYLCQRLSALTRVQCLERIKRFKSCLKNCKSCPSPRRGAGLNIQTCRCSGAKWTDAMENVTWSIFRAFTVPLRSHRGLTFPRAKSCPLCNITALHKSHTRKPWRRRSSSPRVSSDNPIEHFRPRLSPACVRFGPSAAWRLERLKAFRRMKRLKCQHSSLQRSALHRGCGENPDRHTPHPPPTSVGENDNSDRMAYNWLSQSTG